MLGQIGDELTAIPGPSHQREGQRQDGRDDQRAPRRDCWREAYLFHAQYAGKAALVAIQRAVSQDWTAAVTTLGLPAIPENYPG